MLLGGSEAAAWLITAGVLVGVVIPMLYLTVVSMRDPDHVVSPTDSPAVDEETPEGDGSDEESAAVESTDEATVEEEPVEEEPVEEEPVEEEPVEEEPVEEEAVDDGSAADDTATDDDSTA